MRPCTLFAALLLSLPAFTAWAAAPSTPSSATAKTTATATQNTPNSQTGIRAAEDISLPPSAVPPFARADTNHDGKIDWKEAQALKVPKKIFDNDDFDHNGTLNQTEWLFVRLDMTDFTPATATRAPASSTH